MKSNINTVAIDTVKTIHKDKENIQENQRGIFLVSIVSKICESEQNEKKNENSLQIQSAGRKQ